MSRSDDIPADVLAKFSPGTYVDILNAATLTPLFWGVVVDDPSYHSAGLIAVKVESLRNGAVGEAIVGIPTYRLCVRNAIEALGELGVEQG